MFHRDIMCSSWCGFQLCYRCIPLSKDLTGVQLNLPSGFSPLEELLVVRLGYNSLLARKADHLRSSSTEMRYKVFKLDVLISQKITEKEGNISGILSFLCNTSLKQLYIHCMSVCLETITQSHTMMIFQISIFTTYICVQTLTGSCERKRVCITDCKQSIGRCKFIKSV